MNNSSIYFQSSGVICDTENRDPFIWGTLHQLQSLNVCKPDTLATKSYAVPLSVPQIRKSERLSRFGALSQAKGLADVSSVHSAADSEWVTVTCTLLMQYPALANIVVGLCRLRDGNSVMAIIRESEAIEFKGEISALG